MRNIFISKTVSNFYDTDNDFSLNCKVIENNRNVHYVHLYILIHCDTILKCHGDLQLIIKKKRSQQGVHYRWR